MNIKTITYKKMVNFLTISSILICFFIFFIPSADAASGESFLTEMAEDIIQGPMPIIMDTLNPPSNSPTGGANAHEDMGYSALYQDIAHLRLTGLKEISAGLMTLAALWACTIAFTHMIEGMAREEDKLQAIFKAFFEITVTLIILLNLGDVMIIVVGITESLISDLGNLLKVGGSQEITTTAQDLVDNAFKIDKASAITIAFGVVKMFFPWVLVQGLGLMARFIILELIIELGIRRIFCPIAVADIYKDGLRSPGFRYIKKLIACYFRFIIIPVIAIITTSASTSVMENKSGVFAFIALNFAGLSSIKKAESYANDIWGV